MKYQIRLKNRQLKPHNLKITIPTSEPISALQILLTIDPSNSNSKSSIEAQRKYVFWVEESEQETDPMVEGQQYIFNNFESVGLYHISCLTYPKISCTIQIQKQVNESHIFKTDSINNLEEVKEERQDQFKEQSNNGQNEEKDDSDFIKILGSGRQVVKQENRYLHYFKEQFKLWSNFFEDHNQQLSNKENNNQKNQLNIKSVKQNELSIQKIIKKSPFIERQQQNQENVSVIKFDSQVQNTYEEKINQNTTNSSTSTPKKNLFQEQTLLKYLQSWSHHLPQVKIKKKEDQPLQSQYKTFLQNQYKLTTFLQH